MKQDDLKRRLIYIAIMLAALLYIVIAYILIISEGYTINDFKTPFTTLISAVLVTEFVSYLLIKKNWNIDEGEDLQKVLSKDIVKLALAHSITLFGLIYFMISFGG